MTMTDYEPPMVVDVITDKTFGGEHFEIRSEPYAPETELQRTKREWNEAADEYGLALREQRQAIRKVQHARSRERAKATAYYAAVKAERKAQQ